MSEPINTNTGWGRVKAFINNNKGKLLAAGTVTGSAVLGAGAGAAVGGALFGIGALVGAPIGAVVGVLGGSVVVGGMYLGHKVYQRTDAKARFLDLIDQVQGEDVEPSKTRLAQRKAKREQATEQKQQQAVMKEVSKAKEKGALQELFQKYQKENDKKKMDIFFREAVKLCSSNEEKVRLASLCGTGKEIWFAKIIAETATTEDLKELYTLDGDPGVQSIYALTMLSESEAKNAKDVKALLQEFKSLRDIMNPWIEQEFIKVAIQKADVSELKELSEEYPSSNDACVARAKDKLRQLISEAIDAKPDITVSQSMQSKEFFELLDKKLANMNEDSFTIDEEYKNKIIEEKDRLMHFLDDFKNIDTENNLEDLLRKIEEVKAFPEALTALAEEFKQYTLEAARGPKLSHVVDENYDPNKYTDSDELEQKLKNQDKPKSILKKDNGTRDKSTKKVSFANEVRVGRVPAEYQSYAGDGKGLVRIKHGDVDKRQMPINQENPISQKKWKLIPYYYQDTLINIINLENKKDNQVVIDSRRYANRGPSGLSQFHETSREIESSPDYSQLPLKKEDIDGMKSELLQLEKAKMQREGIRISDEGGDEKSGMDIVSFEAMAQERVEKAITEFREKYNRDQRLRDLAGVCVVTQEEWDKGVEAMNENQMVSINREYKIENLLINLMNLEKAKEGQAVIDVSKIGGFEYGFVEYWEKTKAGEDDNLKLLESKFQLSSNILIKDSKDQIKKQLKDLEEIVQKGERKPVGDVGARTENRIQQMRKKYKTDPKLQALAAICIVDKAKVEEAERQAGGNDTNASAS